MGKPQLNRMKKIIALIVLLIGMHQAYAQTDTTIIRAKADTVVITNDTLEIGAQNADTITTFKLKPNSKVIYGIASFYSKGLDGTKTATGERYRNAKLTAASNNIKLNTWVKVTNLSNDNFVIVRINDRMHPRMAKKGRVVDLSGAAAKELDFMKKGLTKVKVEPIDR